MGGRRRGERPSLSLAVNGAFQVANEAFLKGNKAFPVENKDLPRGNEAFLLEMGRYQFKMRHLPLRVRQGTMVRL